MGLLTDGMAGLLQREVQMNTRVVAIGSDSDGAQIRDTSGKTWRAQFVACTIPLPLLRSVELSRVLSGRQAAALEKTPYGRHTDVFLKVTAPFWEEDGLPSSLWTDLSLGTVLHMNRGDIGHLWIAINGPANMPWRGISDDEVMQGVMAELARIRPSTAGRVEPWIVKNWSSNAWTGGHLAYISPGQITEFGGALAQPHGRVYFAGEHTS
ncbi:MAG: FAD-dependent oxidoreductase, partial [Gammaproteobacteria bacterium]|nr:FAD-dependent oxidoreductase [Gammaproteobacteria bacterium]